MIVKAIYYRDNPIILGMPPMNINSGGKVYR